jgi:hypothetical protein
MNKAKGEMAEPSLLDCGLTKSNLREFCGMKFKEDFEQKKNEAAAYPLNTTTPRSALPASMSSNFSAASMATTDEDTCSPESILKPMQLSYPTPQPQIADVSRVEITPGLFVRKPSSRQKEITKVSKVLPREEEVRHEEDSDDDDDFLNSPKLDPQLTMKVDQLFLEHKATKKVPATVAASNNENVSPNSMRAKVEEDVTPEQPPLHARQLAALSTKKYGKGSSRMGDPDEVAAPAAVMPRPPSPQPPESPGSPKLSFAAQKFATKIETSRW